MPFKIFEFQEKSMIDKLLVKEIQFKKTRSTSKDFLPIDLPANSFPIQLGNLKTKLHFQKMKSIKFVVTFSHSLFDNGVCLHFNNGNALNFKITIKTAKKK